MRTDGGFAVTLAERWEIVKRVADFVVMRKSVKMNDLIERQAAIEAVIKRDAKGEINV